MLTGHRTGEARHPLAMFGPATVRPAAPRPVRVAFLARVSTDDRQDPTLSLPRQFANCVEVLPAGWEITVLFWDIESGRTDLERRGRRDAHDRVTVPLRRDGGLVELLAEAPNQGRRFDVVLCESIDRLARRTYVGTHIEHELERTGVRLYAADEPIDPGGKRSTGLLTRRVKQGVAEWYVTDMLERSWDGFKIHTGQGWNVGKPPYGYTARKVEHPVPAKAAAGLTKTRLVPDPVQAPVVAHIFELRVVQRLGYDEIAKRLNTDRNRYPVPEPTDPRRRRGSWSGSAVRDILTNPKYTGYMVWNRRATKSGGRVNPPNAWVWSDQPAHEPLMSQETFEAAMPVARLRRASRLGPGPSSHPQTRHSYLLRTYVWCALCGQRMFGKTRHGTTYYTCQPATNNANRLDKVPPGHPKAPYVREDVLTQALARAVATHVFPPDRDDLLQQVLAARSRPASKPGGVRSLRAQVAVLAARQDRLITELEASDPGDQALRERLRRRFDSLEAEREAKAARLQAVVRGGQQRLDDPGVAAALAALRDVRISDAPAAVQRQLYDALHLQIRYHRTDIAAHIEIRLVLPTTT